MKPKKKWEFGLKANCWFCDSIFKKIKFCNTCRYYICPECNKCGCHLNKDQKDVIDKTFRALKPIFEKCNYCPITKTMEKIYKHMISLEYILDSTNQKRKRQDKAVKKAWGYAFYIKGKIINSLPYYQPTLMMIEDKWKVKKCNPTWTRRTKKMFEIVQQAKKISLGEPKYKKWRNKDET